MVKEWEREMELKYQIRWELRSLEGSSDGGGRSETMLNF